jgi:hypothetical protein
MEKDNNYWILHKEIYNEMMADLDTDVIRKIYDNPNCTEARLLQKRVDRAIQDKTKQLQPK